MSLHRNDISNLKKYNLEFAESWQVVDYFEKLVANYYGAPWAVAVDSCTHAIELSLRVTGIDNRLVVLPKHTYMSIGMMLDELDIPYILADIEWKDYYPIGTYPVLDAAVSWSKNSYVPGTKMCISFQFKKTFTYRPRRHDFVG